MSDIERAEYWRNNPQLFNALLAECKGAAALYDAIFALKSVRGRLAALGAAAIPADAYPPPAELSHLTAAKVALLFAALDSLDAALVTPAALLPAPAPQVPPIAAVVGAIR